MLRSNFLLPFLLACIVATGCGGLANVPTASDAAAPDSAPPVASERDRDGQVGATGASARDAGPDAPECTGGVQFCLGHYCRLDVDSVCVDGHWTSCPPPDPENCCEGQTPPPCPCAPVCEFSSAPDRHQYVCSCLPSPFPCGGATCSGNQVCAAYGGDADAGPDASGPDYRCVDAPATCDGGVPDCSCLNGVTLAPPNTDSCRVVQCGDAPAAPGHVEVWCSIL